MNRRKKFSVFVKKDITFTFFERNAKSVTPLKTRWSATTFPPPPTGRLAITIPFPWPWACFDFPHGLAMTLAYQWACNDLAPIMGSPWPCPWAHSDLPHGLSLPMGLPWPCHSHGLALPMGLSWPCLTRPFAFLMSQNKVSFSKKF